MHVLVRESYAELHVCWCPSLVVNVLALWVRSSVRSSGSQFYSIRGKVFVSQLMSRLVS